jgi:glucuronate isomerase
MGNFLKDDFLLQSDTAAELYHNYAKHLPIIDYHSHLPPDQIAANHQFKTITEIWLAGDHYKWRALRTLGVEEKYITGAGTDQEKFRKWAAAVPYTLRNPLFHWTHMELKNPFGVEELLNADNADRIYDQTTAQLQTPEFSTQGLLTHFNVEMVGTTDDPADSLEHHQKISGSDFKTKILPSFRPDKSFNIAQGDTYRTYLKKLGAAAGVTINKLDDLLQALKNRINFFHEQGCRISDHGLNAVPLVKTVPTNLNEIFEQVVNGNDQQAEAVKNEFLYYVLHELCAMYQEKGWVQQLHLGALRNNNTRMLSQLGADTGYDSIGDFQQAEGLSNLLNSLEAQNSLAKTIIYNLNPSDNAVFAAMVGNFQSEGIKGKVQFGSGWWFLDQLDGMTDQINSLSTIGLVSCFIGMLTDSRSFLSYSRHEYFRRLVCNIFANDIKQGMIPNDLEWTGKIIGDICYHNARNYFG